MHSCVRDVDRLQYICTGIATCNGGYGLHERATTCKRWINYICKRFITCKISTTYKSEYYPILSYLVLSYPILSYLILSYPVLSYPTLPYPTLSYYPYHIIHVPYHTYHQRPYPNLSYPILTKSYSTLLYVNPILPYPCVRDADRVRDVDRLQYICTGIATCNRDYTEEMDYMYMKELLHVRDGLIICVGDSSHVRY